MSLDATPRETKLTRDPSVDMIRCFAFMLVVTVHFCLRSGMREAPVVTWQMFLFCTIRSFSVSCVPIFIMLTGYLQKNKRPEASYFVKIIPVYTVYVLATLANIAFNNIYGDDHDGPLYVIMKILNFKGARYAWYVEMFLTLFLLTPYLNLIWKGLETRRARKFLVFVMLLVAVAPSGVNIWRLVPLSWWKTPSTNTIYIKWIPYWFKHLYPFAYYFIGCYLAEYKVRFDRRKGACAIAALTLFAGAFNYWRSTPETFLSASWANYSSPITALMAFLLFVFILSGDHRKMSARSVSFFKFWSSLTFGAYLLSNITDTVFYDRLIQAVEDPERRLPWILVIVPLSAAISCIMSWVVNLAAVPLSKGLTFLAWKVIKRFNLTTETEK